MVCLRQTVGLGEVVSSKDHGEAAHGATVLCPVCGMETSASGGPMVHAAHGEQAVHTCSLNHAHQVHDNILQFRDAEPAAEPAAAQVQDEDFCTGTGTTMLNGFGWWRGEASPCVVLWFPGWVLSSQLRYVVGCVLVALVAVANEYLLQLRRVLRRESSLKRLESRPDATSSERTQLLRSTSAAAARLPLVQTCAPAWFRSLSADSQHVIHCALHGATIGIAYLLMLVAMTYDLGLFASCILGYIAGHYVYGERRDAVGELSFPST